MRWHERRLLLPLPHWLCQQVGVGPVGDVQHLLVLLLLLLLHRLCRLVGHSNKQVVAPR